MKRLAGLWVICGALIGCSQGREGLRPTDGLGPAALPPGLPPIRERVNAGPGPVPPGLPDGRAAADPAAPEPADRIGPDRPAIARIASGPADRPDRDAPAPPPIVAPAPAPQASPDDPASELPRELPELEHLAESAPALAADPSPPPSVDGPGPIRVDPELRRASATGQEARAADEAEAGGEVPVGATVGEWAARVDHDIITWNELQSEVARRFRELDPQTQSAPGVREALAASVLDHLIDRSLVIQKARRNELKDAARWELINKFAVELFEKERLPALLKRYNVPDRYALERVLAERNESFEEILESFKLEAIYQQLLMMNVASKVHVDLPEMRAYYFAHRDDEAFRQGPQLTWREIQVRFANHPSREAARAKLEEAVARIASGTPFEEVARAMGEGPNADAGGLWTTAPGSYAVASVNAALAALRPGQVSPILEGPVGLHLVRLEAVRPAGRKRFEEVQDEIRELLKARKQADLVDAYLKDLYRGAVVTTVFREYVPRHLRPDGPGG